MFLLTIFLCVSIHVFGHTDDTDNIENRKDMEDRQMQEKLKYKSYRKRFWLAGEKKGFLTRFNHAYKLRHFTVNFLSTTKVTEETV